MIFTPDQLGGFAEYHGSTAQSETGRNYEEVAARLAPTKWTRWAWPAYLGDGRTAEEALADPRVCPHAAPGALAGVGGVRTVVATALADTLHDEGAAAAAALAAAGAAIHHVEIRGSPPGPAWAQRFFVVRRPAQDMYMTDPTKDDTRPVV